VRPYAADTPLNLPSADQVVETTEGVTASVHQELVRGAVLCPIDRGAFDERIVHAALAELTAERQPSTRNILGG
jgi:hypothetical protein